MKKRLLSTLLALCVALALLPVTALAAETSGSCGDGVTWSYSDGTLTIEGSGPMVVTRTDSPMILWPWFDYSEQIHTVKIGEGVTYIAESAFYKCSNLTSVTIANTVAAIGDEAFHGCASLAGVTIPNSVTTIGSGAFSGCEVLTNVTIPSSVTTIQGNAFSGCSNLGSLVIPNSVTKLAGVAFYGSGLTSVTIPDSITTIETSTFENCTKLTSVIIPASVTAIEGYAFSGCRSLTSVTIPASVTSIGSNAFTYCDNLKDVYYTGSESQWNQIDNKGTQYLDLPFVGATYHFDSQPTTPAEPEQPTGPSVPATPPAGKVMLSPQNLAVDGKNVECEKYNIDDRNYFKLRDLAQLLSGTGSQFEVGYDEATATVSITTGQAYTPNGTELLAGVDNSASTQPSSQSIQIDGEKCDTLTVYNIGGSNFFQLRELGNILGFEVDFDQDTNTAIVNSVEK